MSDMADWLDSMVPERKLEIRIRAEEMAAALGIGVARSEQAILIGMYQRERGLDTLGETPTPPPAATDPLSDD